MCLSPLQVKVTILADNEATACFPYLVQVFTGYRRGAGTSAKVGEGLTSLQAHFVLSMVQVLPIKFHDLGHLPTESGPSLADLSLLGSGCVGCRLLCDWLHAKACL